MGIKYIISLQDTKTETIRYILWSCDFPEDKTEEGEEDSVAYMWDSGNYSCDCNRAIYFYGRNEEGTPYYDNYSCGDSRFKLLSIEKVTSTKEFRITE